MICEAIVDRKDNKLCGKPAEVIVPNGASSVACFCVEHAIFELNKTKIELLELCVECHRKKNYEEMLKGELRKATKDYDSRAREGQSTKN
jgi:hypothetical protein